MLRHVRRVRRSGGGRGRGSRGLALSFPIAPVGQWGCQVAASMGGQLPRRVEWLCGLNVLFLSPS